MLLLNQYQGITKCQMFLYTTNKKNLTFCFISSQNERETRNKYLYTS
jgi:hypothetical protein